MPGKHLSTARFAGVLVALFVFAPLRAEAHPVAIDLELVLAVDVSGSMSRAELFVQRNGYIAALRSAEVGAAIAFRGSVALAYVEWAGPEEQRIVVPWTIVTDAGDKTRFAENLAAAPLDPGFHSPPWQTGTSISRALLFVAGMFSSNGASRTIDISGNGPNNTGGPLAPIRERIIADGITINGLPIVRPGDAASASPLVAYFEDCVIGGPGAFAIPVHDPALLTSAVRRKLLLEIAAMPDREMPATFLTPISFVTAPWPGIDCGRG